MAKVDYYSMFFAVVVTLLLGCTAAAARHRRHPQKTLSTLFSEHMNTVNNFECSQPQQRLVRLSEFMNIRPDKFYFPPATVLNRCDCHTGYCPNDEYTCGPNVTEPVQLVIQVRTLEGVREGFITIDATNHVSCSCQPDSNKIK